MNKQLKAKWVKALRSGKYKQGAGSLVQIHDGGDLSFCCLGVLRDIAPISRGSVNFGLLDPLTCGIPEQTQQELATYNDNGKSFKWIAANIERRKSL